MRLAESLAWGTPPLERAIGRARLQDAVHALQGEIAALMRGASGEEAVVVTRCGEDISTLARLVGEGSPGSPGADLSGAFRGTALPLLYLLRGLDEPVAAAIRWAGAEDLRKSA